MAQNTTIQIPGGAWAQLTDANVTAIRLQNLGSSDMWVMATAGATPPSDFEGAIRFGGGQGDVIVLADMFAGVTGANRVWAWSQLSGDMSVSHA